MLEHMCEFIWFRVSHLAATGVANAMKLPWLVPQSPVGVLIVSQEAIRKMTIHVSWSLVVVAQSWMPRMVSRAKRVGHDGCCVCGRAAC